MENKFIRVEDCFINLSHVAQIRKEGTNKISVRYGGINADNIASYGSESDRDAAFENIRKLLED